MAVAAIAVVAALAAGCSNGSSPSSSPSGATGSSGTLRVVLATEPRSLHPDLDNNISSIGLDRTMIEPLVQSEDNTYAPSTAGLTTKWTSVDSLTWNLTVRTGVTFQNGEKFDASVAAYNIMRSHDDATGATKPYFAQIASATALNDTTVQVKTTTADPTLPDLMMMVSVFPPTYYKKVGADAFGKHPIGTGPFEFKAWNPGQNIQLTRYAGYWGDKAKVAGVTFTFASEESTRASLLQSKQVDIASGLGPQTINDLKSATGIKTLTVPSLMKLYLFFNLHEAPFNNVKVREAVAAAVDVDALVKSVFQSTGAVVDRSFFGSIFPGVGTDDKQTYDLAKAKELVKEAGNIGTIDFHWPVGRYSMDQQVGEAISGMLEAAGFKVKRDPMETSAYFTLLTTNKMTGMHLLGSLPPYPQEDAILSSYFLKDAVVTYCSDGHIDADAAKALTTTDGTARDELYTQIADYLVNDLVCPVPLYRQVDGYAALSSVSGFSPSFIQNWQGLRNVSLG